MMPQPAARIRSAGTSGAASCSRSSPLALTRPSPATMRLRLCVPTSPELSIRPTNAVGEDVYVYLNTLLSGKMAQLKGLWLKSHSVEWSAVMEVFPRVACTAERAELAVAGRCWQQLPVVPDAVWRDKLVQAERQQQPTVLVSRSFCPHATAWSHDWQTASKLSQHSRLPASHENCSQCIRVATSTC